MFRNSEIRTECIIDAAATAVLAAAGFFVHPLAGVLLLALGGGLTALHLLLGRKRYARIAALTARVDRVLHEAVPTPIEGSEEGELAILSDEIRKMTVRLKEQSDRLTADKVFLSDAIADLFHQMRTPLTSMNLLAELLKDETLPEERRIRYLHELKQQLSRMQWMTETLLKLSKLDANTVRFAPEPMPVGTLIDLAAEPLLIPMELKNIAFTVDDGNAQLTADRAWTAEALSNILKNGLEHTPEGGEIRVTAEETPLFTRITVRDSGPGFSKEDLARLFERFYRGSSASVGSIGIGLALARQIVVGQNGTVVAKNAENGGAQFVITFYKAVL